MTAGEDTRRGAPRPRVLIGAYACGPVEEPEARAGWEFAAAAARDHDVWVVTRPRFRESVSAALAADPALAARMHVAYLDLSPALVRRKRRGWDLYWYYPLWQRALGRRAREFHDRHRFDVAHHVTFANDWMPSGLTAIADEVPLVWGPVGGSSSLPIARLAKWLGARGTATEVVRSLVTRTARRLGGDPVARRARLVVAQNPQVADAFARRGAATVVEPNAALAELPIRAPHTPGKTAVFAGRLLAWKGAALAIDALAQPAADGWHLRIFGAGYDEARLRRLVARRGLQERVEFRGHRPRAEVLDAIAAADVFLFPSMHDQAGWVVAEASSMGVPTVCLPLGGPPVLAEPNAHIAELHGDIASNVAAKIVEAASAPGTPTDRWSVSRLPDVVSEWYEQVRGSQESPRPLRVLESFRAPKPTTNPYITQLHDSLNARADIDVLPFDFRTALTGRYDLVHLHWPELLMGGHNWRGRAARRALTTLLIARWQLSRRPIVRTVHNLERPTNINGYDRLLLDRLDALTTLDIRLNAQTPAREGIPGVVIPHGHYRDWFAPVPRSARAERRIGYVGLIRRYKGVEDLISAFVAWPDADARLHVAGKPSTDELLDTLRERVGTDDRVTIDPRFLDENELVSAITAAGLIVLPYRHMHNSGTALAALSLDTPVLLPDNEVNRALADEVGTDWVQVFSGDLTPDILRDALTAVAGRHGQPDLSARDWTPSAAAHAAAFHSQTAR